MVLDYVPDSVIQDMVDADVSWVPTLAGLAAILVVEGDPLVDLRALQSPRLVIHEGIIIRHEPPAPRRAGGRRHNL